MTYFKSLWTEMTHLEKFKGRQCLLLVALLASVGFARSDPGAARNRRRRSRWSAAVCGRGTGGTRRGVVRGGRRANASRETPLVAAAGSSRSTTSILSDFVSTAG